jgi:F0F1-type ATP synthase epsilon subunit
MSQTSGRQDHYFVSGGFALVHPNSSMEISALHAVDINELDPSVHFFTNFFSREGGRKTSFSSKM